MGKAHVVLVEKGLQCRSTSSFDLNQRRPTLDEVTEQQCIYSVKPLKRLRIVLFQCITEAIGDPHSDRVTKLFVRCSTRDVRVSGSVQHSVAAMA